MVEPKRASLIALAAIAFSSYCLAGEIVHGRVVDGGKPGKGIAAVTVRIQDKDGKLLKAGLTDAGGRYRLDVPGQARYALFDKPDYGSRALRHRLQPGAQAQADVVLVAKTGLPQAANGRVFDTTSPFPVHENPQTAAPRPAR